MAKRVIILGVQTQNDIFNNADCVFWFPISTGAVVQASGSVWPGASTAENTAIQNGSVVEERRSFQFPVGITLAQGEIVLLQHWTNRNAQIAGRGSGVAAGVFNDSVTGWSA